MNLFMLSLPVWCKCCCLHFCYRAVLPATRQPCLVVVALRMGYVQTRRTFEKEAGLAGLWCMPLIPLLRRQRPKKEKKKTNKPRNKEQKQIIKQNNKHMNKQETKRKENSRPGGLVCFSLRKEGLMGGWQMGSTGLRQGLRVNGG